MELKKRIKKVIVDSLALGMNPDEISDELPLFHTGLGLDSVAAMEIVVGLENEFGIFFEDEELEASIFANVQSLAAYIEQKLDRNVDSKRD